MPKGATPIDFAYAVHTDVGNSCVGCKINGNVMPVITELQNGDEVEVIRSRSQSPPAAWESIVTTGKARSAIRKATRTAIRKQYSGLGTRILERAFSRINKTFDREALASAISRLARESLEDVLTDVGRGELSSLDVIKAVFPDHKEERATEKPKKEEGWFNLKAGANMLFRLPGRENKRERLKEFAKEKRNAIPVRGAGNELPIHFASDGGAVPGDRIVGILEPGVGITIYPINSPALARFEESDRWLDVRWDIDEGNTTRFPARMNVVAINEPGTLAKITEVIANNDGNIQNLEMKRTSTDFMDMTFDIEVWDLNHLTRIIRQLVSKPMVSKVERIIG